jgi:hypothetical protein
MLFKICLPFLALLCSSPSIANELSWDGFGDIKFGKSLEEISRTTGLEFVPTKGGTAWSEACKYVEVKGDSSIRFMIENGILTRAEVPVKTPTLFAINMSASLDKIKMQHPNAVVMNHKYVMEGHYIIFYSLDKSKALLLEHYESKVQIMRAGMVPSVMYVEGCL